MDSPKIQPQQEIRVEEMSQAEIAARYGLAKWVFNRSRNYAKGNVLEIGEGDGIVAKYCKREGIDITVININLEEEVFVEKYADLIGMFDLVYFLRNSSKLVVNKLVIDNSACLLKRDGCLITIFPCTVALFQGVGQGLDDWKSKNRRAIRAKIGMLYELERTRYCELLSMLPSMLSPESDYDERVRLFQSTSANNFIPIGLHILTVLKKI